jgi:hypothetical protein
MPYEQDVKELAYTIDPPCWESYSGKGRNFKAAMDNRRNKALALAQEEIDRIKERRMERRHYRASEDSTQNFMVEITSADGCRSVEYTDDICLGDDIARWSADPVQRIVITPN